MKRISTFILSILILVITGNIVSAQQPKWIYERGLGDDQVNKKNYDEAVIHYTACIKNNEKADDCYSKRGMAYQALGKTNEAKADFSEAMKLNPKHQGATDGVSGATNSSQAGTEKQKEDEGISEFMKSLEEYLDSKEFADVVKADSAKSGKQVSAAVKSDPKPNVSKPEPRVTPSAAQLNKDTRKMTPELKQKTAAVVKSQKDVQKAAKAELVAREVKPKTEREWEAICDPFWSRMYDAVHEKLVNTDAAKKIYDEFNSATAGSGTSSIVKIKRDSLLRDMFQSRSPALQQLVESEMQRLKHNDRDKDYIRSERPQGIIV